MPASQLHRERIQLLYSNEAKIENKEYGWKYNKAKKKKIIKSYLYVHSPSNENDN